MSDIVTDTLTAYLGGRSLVKNAAWNTDSTEISGRGQVMAKALGLSETNIDAIAQNVAVALEQRRRLPADEVAEFSEFHQYYSGLNHQLSYFVKLEEALDDFDPDSTLNSVLPLWAKQLRTNRQYMLSETFPGLESVPLDSIYVEPTFEEYTGDNRLGFGLNASLRNRRIPAKIAGLPAIARRLRGLNMVFADPGSGKTTFTHQLCRHLILDQTGRSPMLPVLVRLRDVPGNPQDSVLAPFFKRCLGSAVKNNRSGDLSLELIEFFRHCSQQKGPLPLFILDGLDEYRGPDSWLVDEVGVLSALGPVVVTSRLGVESQLVHQADARYRIRPLELDEMSRLVRSLVPHELEQQQAFDHLDRYPDLRRLAANPFVLSAFCGLHLMASTSRDDMPRNRTELLAALTEAGFMHYRQLDPALNKLSRPLRRSIHRLAAWMQLDSQSSPEYQFVTEPDPGEYTPAEEATRALECARLTQKTWRYGHQEFVHPLVQEFFAGSRIIDLLTSTGHARGVMNELVRQADSPKFQGPLQFAVGLTRRHTVGGLTEHLSSLATRMLKTSDPFGVRAFHLARFMVEAGADRFPREEVRQVLDQLWDTVNQGFFDQDLIEAMVSLDPTDIRRRIDETRDSGDPFEITALPKIQAALTLHEDALAPPAETSTRAVLAASEARCFRDLAEPLSAETCRQVLDSAQTDEQWSAASRLVARLGGNEAAALVMETTRRGLSTAADESLASALGWVSHPAATDVLMAICWPAIYKITTWWTRV